MLGAWRGKEVMASDAQSLKKLCRSKMPPFVYLLSPADASLRPSNLLISALTLSSMAVSFAIGTTEYWPSQVVFSCLQSQSLFSLRTEVLSPSQSQPPSLDSRPQSPPVPAHGAPDPRPRGD